MSTSSDSASVAVASTVLVAVVFLAGTAQTSGRVRECRRFGRPISLRYEPIRNVCGCDFITLARLLVPPPPAKGSATTCFELRALDADLVDDFETRRPWCCSQACAERRRALRRHVSRWDMAFIGIAEALGRTARITEGTAGAVEASEAGAAGVEVVEGAEAGQRVYGSWMKWLSTSKRAHHTVRRTHWGGVSGRPTAWVRVRSSRQRSCCCCGRASNSATYGPAAGP
ncbi:hypothetical protein C8R45DRAFT_1040858 [Mycena sanguinolenta]|nr:hypothetical protein C8R45DRAFT_1040858 [Mycena sanguinolenta]